MWSGILSSRLKYALIFSGTLAAIIFFGLWRLEVAETRNLEAQIDTLQDTVIDFETALNECSDNVAKSEEIQGEHARKITALNRQLAKFNGLRDPKNAKCVPISR